MSTFAGPFFPMQDEVTVEEIQKAVGRRVEVIAFGISYVGFLRKVDLRTGTVRIQDKEDYAVLEIERIESFRSFRKTR